MDDFDPGYRNGEDPPARTSMCFDENLTRGYEARNSRHSTNSKKGVSRNMSSNPSIKESAVDTFIREQRDDSVHSETKIRRRRSKHSKASSRMSSRRGISLALENKSLPDNFHERVVELEHKIEQRRFNLDNVNELMLLYSQAVEYYNGINDNKFVIYQDLIQKILVKPEVLIAMSSASKDPAAYAKE